jgi:thiol-disulfide isomerase/thioredoxin
VHPGSFALSVGRGAAAVLLASTLLACGGAQAVPSDARSTVISLDHVDSAELGLHLATALRREGGVYKTNFDKRRAELTVVAAPGFDALAAARRLSSSEAFGLVPGAGHGAYVAWPSPPAGGDIEVVTTNGGEIVPELLPVVVPGKVTVVDFSAVWCEPCKRLDEHMNWVAASKGDVAYRKLDVGDWDSPLAKRYLHDVPYLPFVIVYDRAGREVERISGLDVGRLDAAIAAGAARPRGGS